MSGWVAVLVVGAGTYLMRLSFIALWAKTGVPGWMDRPLRFVAPAVLAALVTSEVVVGESGSVDLMSPRVAAAVVAGIVAWRIRNLAAPVVAGMAALWILQAI